MSDDAARLKSYETYAEEVRRYDYYVVSGAGIALGYTLSALHSLATRADWLVPVSWALFLLSLGAGISHLRSKVLTLAAGHQRHSLMQDLSDRLNTLESGGTSHHIESGAILQGDTLEYYVEQLRIQKRALDARIERYQRRSQIVGTLRDYWLVSGVAIFALWRCIALLQSSGQRQ